MTNIYSKSGSSFYVLWGVLHIVVASKVYTMAQGVDVGIVQGRIFQDAWSLLFFAVFAIIVGIFFNWKNDQLGYWLNLIIVSVADIGYIIFILVPGYIPIIPGIIGPALWILAVVFSTIGIKKIGIMKKTGGMKMSEEAVVAKRGPYAVDVEEGKTYWWCSCGRSQNQPFCDGSHEGTQFSPVEFVAEKTAKIALCGCKRTKNQPRCDDTHFSIKP